MSSVVSSIRESGGNVDGGSAAQRPRASSFYNEVYAFVANQFGSEPVPRGIVKTFADPNWRKALLSEFDSLVTNKVFVIEDYPKQFVKVIYMHLINSEKRDENGHVVKKKSRLVVNGSAQSREDSYFETFAPVLTRELPRLPRKDGRFSSMTWRRHSFSHHCLL